MSTKPLRTKVECSPNASTTATYSGGLFGLMGQGGGEPGWEVDASCVVGAEPTAAPNPGTLGPYCLGWNRTGGTTWQFPSVYTAEAAAQAAINANLGNLDPLGTVTMPSFDAVDGSGQVTLVLQLDETGNAITRMVHHPVTTEAEGVATPTALGG